MTQEEKVVISNDILFADVISLLSAGHTVTLRAKGDSMFPFIVGDRDCVVLQKIGSVQERDIVLARLNGKGYVLHRVYRIAGDDIILMGDGNVCAKERCRAEDICGTVLEIIRGGQHITCRSLKERWKVRFWKVLLPVRRYILGIHRRWRQWSRGRENIRTGKGYADE